jgi:hypothetical protein
MPRVVRIELMRTTQGIVRATTHHFPISMHPHTI